MFKVVCIDSNEIAMARKRELDIPRDFAKELGIEAVEISKNGFYINEKGERIDIKDYLDNAIQSKVSIPPEKELDFSISNPFDETEIQITNETTLGAAKRLIDEGGRPLALNLANGVEPGGGFLKGSRAQEETLCRSSALYLTLKGDPMYKYHKKRLLPDSTDWTIYSPDVPVFREDNGVLLDKPYLLSFLSCAAPVASVVGYRKSRSLLKQRIKRILSIAVYYGYTDLILGAWGCGAFKNNPYYTAIDFKDALENEFKGTFSKVVFAIADWSPERRFLKPFCEVFNGY